MKQFLVGFIIGVGEGLIVRDWLLSKQMLNLDMKRRKK